VVFDEIFTGLGRTGEVFAFDHENVAPDLLVLGKALGGGMPLSACVGSPDVMTAWPTSRGEAMHTSTFLGHPLSCASALAFLDILDRDGLAGESGRKGQEAIAHLRVALSGVPAVREVRGRGLAIGVELQEPGSTMPAAGAGARVAEEALTRGVLVLPAGETGEVVELAPPATITQPQMHDGLDRLVAAIEAAVA
jgi:4-aminobutyrate aminotransferase/(S)-3-amino-2-methylpropionate transaminase